MFKAGIEYIRRIAKSRTTGKDFLERNIGKSDIMLWGEFLNSEEGKESFEFISFLVINSNLLEDKTLSKYIKDNGAIGLFSLIQKKYQQMVKEEEIKKRELSKKEDVRKRGI
jgi:hypothetical protein